MYDILELSKKLLPELREIGKELNIKRIESFKKQDLIYVILDTQAIRDSVVKTPEKKVATKEVPAPKIPKVKVEVKPPSEKKIIRIVKKSGDMQNIEAAATPADDQNSPALIAENDLFSSETVSEQPEQTPVEKPFHAKGDKVRKEPIQQKERRPRVLRSESAILSVSSVAAAPVDGEEPEVNVVVKSEGETTESRQEEKRAPIIKSLQKKEFTPNQQFAPKNGNGQQPSQSKQ